MTSNSDMACAGGQDSTYHLHGGAFARTIRAQEAKHLAPMYRKTGIINCAIITVITGNVIDRDENFPVHCGVNCGVHCEGIIRINSGVAR